MEKKKFTTEELRAMSTQEFNLLKHELPHHKEELETGFNQLPDSLKPSAAKLIDLLTEDAATQIHINGPKSLHITRSGRQLEEIEFDLIDSESYYFFFNQFLLPLTEITERTGADILFEGFLSIPDLHNPGWPFPPRVARVHAIDHPIVDGLKITIATEPRG